MKIAFKLAKIVGMDFAARTLGAYGNNSREYQTKNMYSNVYVAFFACIIIGHYSVWFFVWSNCIHNFIQHVFNTHYIHN